MQAIEAVTCVRRGVPGGSPRALTERQAVLDVLHERAVRRQSRGPCHVAQGGPRARCIAKCASGAPRPGIRPMPWSRRSGPGISLKGPIPYSLYVILDLFSRYVVGWMARATKMRTWPSASLWRPARSRASPHTNSRADRGAPMRSTLRGRHASHSRPRVSNDVLRRSGPVPPVEHARSVSREQRRAPPQRPERHVHYGRAATVLAARHRTRWPPTPPIPSGSCRGHPVPRRCPPRSGSIGRRHAPARRPPARRPSLHSTGARSRGHARHQRGVATVNAESCRR